MFHNEHSIPQIVEAYIQRHQVTDDLANMHKKMLQNHRKHLDMIENRMIKLIQYYD